MYTIQSSAMEFKNHKVYEYTLAGRPLVIETGTLIPGFILRKTAKR